MLISGVASVKRARIKLFVRFLIPVAVAAVVRLSVSWVAYDPLIIGSLRSLAEDGTTYQKYIEETLATYSNSSYPRHLIFRELAEISIIQLFVCLIPIYLYISMKTSESHRNAQSL